MYPLKFKSIYVKKPWQGLKLPQYKKNYDGDSNSYGISWEVSGHESADTQITNGVYAGKNLSDVIEGNEVELLGMEFAETKGFPLRLAYLDAAEDLSIQVHPQESYARLHENDGGKSESWYIIEADKGATLVAGITITDVTLIKEAALNGSLEQYLVRVPVQAGDIINIKAGLIHALGAGILAIEVGENSNITYRLYDYGRGREIDVDKSMDVIRPEYKVMKSPYLTIENEGYDRSFCYLEKEYAVEIITLKTEYPLSKKLDRFYMYMLLEGEAVVKYEGGSVSISQGESVLIPANTTACCFEGKGRLMKCYVPNMEKAKEEVINALRFHGDISKDML